ncbi:MAG: beta-ketoacyl synthase N-terminal-like domain-containing protein [Bacteroidetes bacterium]|nr:beta-ketoacyl synthase N-terminal-like domain-containing protein [Bacteroidota bacterium]
MEYINGIGIISPQNTLPGSGFLEPVVVQTADFMKSVEPVYKAYIDPIASRRMSRLIKMGISSAKICLQDAGIQSPDAIITGTGLGSVEDTEKILGELTKEEKFLNPTPFIQSTYNTISSQIAINLKCHQYNSTFVHRCFSLESCLTDAILQIREGSATNVLAGGIDEMTLNHLTIIRRLGLWKKEAIRNLDLWTTDTPGALAGEGSAYFMISGERTEKTYARLAAAETLYRPVSVSYTASFVRQFLSDNGLLPGDVDIVLMGNNGHAEHDMICNEIIMQSVPGAARILYKHLCGEYHTVSGFAMYIAANILKKQYIPASLLTLPSPRKKLTNILIHNHFRNTDHAFILIRK